MNYTDEQIIIKSQAHYIKELLHKLECYEIACRNLNRAMEAPEDAAQKTREAQETLIRVHNQIIGDDT